MVKAPVIELQASALAASPALELGESVRVDSDRGVVWFVDITSRQLFRVLVSGLEDPGAYEARELPGEPGFVAVTMESDVVLLGLPDGIFRYNWGAGELALVAHYEHVPGTVRVNDGAVSPWGEIWYGTMNLGEGPAAGYLYRVVGDRSVVVDGPVVCWNGIDWSPGGREMYATDTLGGVIRRYRVTGVGPGGAESPIMPDGTLVTPGASRGWLPDGLLVDPQGGVWSALWGGARVTRLRDDRVETGVEVDVIVHTPGSRPTSLAFLPDGQMLITTASTGTRDGRLCRVSAESMRSVPNVAPPEM